MNYMKVIMLATLVLAGHTATADFKTVERANEVRLSEFRLPASLNGIATFKPCGACAMQAVSVSAETRYRLNDQFVSLPEMRRLLATVVANRDRKTVIVMHHLESDLITQISVKL